MEYLRDRVWEQMVEQKLVEKKIDEYGITVTDDEVRDIILGPNPPAFLRQNFIDSNGVFNREMYQQALFDPQNKAVLIQAEAAVKQQQIQVKLQNFLEASVFVSDAELKRDFINKNTDISAEYALVQQVRLTDSSITVSDDEIKDYYNEHKEDYKIEPKRKIKYVLFEKKAVEDDTLSVKNNLNALINDMEEDTVAFQNFVNIYSEQPYSVDTVAINQLSADAVSALNEASSGDVVGPVLTNQGFVVYHLINKYEGGDEYVRASHILVKGTDEKAKAKADSLYNVLKQGADFAEVAKKVSEDPGSGRRGGDLGWFGKGQMVPQFEDASFNGKIDVIQEPVESQFGYHIIKVTGKSKEKFVVEKIVNKIAVSPTTLDRIHENADDFSYLAKENDFDSEAKLMNYSVVEAQPFAETASFIPGLGSAKTIVKFAFENSVGDISEAFTVPSGYVVAMITEKIDAGYQPLDDVKARIRTAITSEKKMAKAVQIASDVKNKIGNSGDLKQAESISQYVKYGTVDNFNVGKKSIPGIGADFAFIEYCLSGELNKVSNPVEGTRGAYLIKVTGRTPFNETAFNLQKSTLRNSLIQQKRSQFFEQWIAKLKDEAEIEDNRYQFYR